MTKILIAEDNDLNLKLMTDILLIQNYEVEAVCDGDAALKKLMECEYDLLLLDLQMPKVSGFEVLEELNKCKHKVKTVVVSACAMAPEIDRAKELGCLDFITKPIRLNNFLSTIKKVLE
jgi:two-component system cell cycle response regulator DivK